MSSRYKIFLLDDRQDMLDSFEEVLSVEFDVVTEVDCFKALKYLKCHKFDAIILDVNMPMMSGFDVYRELSTFVDLSDTAVMFLSSVTNIHTKVEGLELGADDYIIKPVLSKELLARVRNRIKRLIARPVLKFSHGKTTLYVETHKVEFEGVDLRLTPTEFKILFFLWKRLNTISTKDDIKAAIWGNTEIGKHTIDTHVSNLRSKILDPKVDINSIKNQGLILDLLM